MADGWIWHAERITCVPPAGFPKDPAVTRALHSFDPGIIPIWREALYTPPGESSPRVFVHHGIGRYYPNPRQLRRRFHVEMPSDADFQAPNFLDAIFEDVYSESYVKSGPGAYLPWDWSVYKWCRERFIEITVKAYLKRLEKRKAREDRERASWQDDLNRREKELEPWIQKQLAKLSDADWEKYLAYWAEREKEKLEAIRTGRPIPKRRPVKPMVDLGKTAARSPRAPWETYARVAPSS